jgi:hypothetical protein
VRVRDRKHTRLGVRRECDHEEHTRLDGNGPYLARDGRY